MINFEPITLEQKTLYQNYLFDGQERSCAYSFANLYMWGRQKAAIIDDHLVLFSEFDSHCFYPFPIGNGNKKSVLEAIFADAKERNLCPCLAGLNEDAKLTLEYLYPNTFYFHADRGGFDYVYDINDLADLKGRKLHRKRNHLKHFQKNHPNYIVEPISDFNINEVGEFIAEWYETKLKNNPDNDYHHEQAALEKALSYFKELDMEGLVLKEYGKVLGFTMASPISHDTYDVHFEKARGDIDGAYTTINSAFANYIRNKHPHIKYLDREEDMGLLGLRKAKQSYYPHHMIKKYSAFPLRQTFAYSEPMDTQIPVLRELWKEAFHDSDEFLDIFFGTAFASERCRVAAVNNTTGSCDIAGALYWFDCSVNGQKMAYVYAVATAKKYRGQGTCHTLLADTHRHLKGLGYQGVLLVPGHEGLVRLYEGAEYETCTRISEIQCSASDMNISVQRIEKEEYAALRYAYLPKNSVIQENENLDFLELQAHFYKGENFILAASIENENLYGCELLGDTSFAPGIVSALGCKDGTFRTPGKDLNFAMFHALDEDAAVPGYLGFAFD